MRTAWHVRLLLILLLPLTWQLAHAQAAADSPIDRSDPVAMLKQTTDRALELSQQARTYAAQDRDRFYNEVAAVVDQVVDQTYFARGVMGPYASVRLYKSLKSAQERQAFRDRLERFTETLKRSFIVTYADALLSFDGERIELHPPAQTRTDEDEITIGQSIYSRNNRYSVQYRLHKTNSGDWLIANVIVEGLNMGSVYRNQFAEAVERHGGDVEYVVDHWQQIMRRESPELPTRTNNEK